MRVLILTCNTGEGHNSTALALKEELFTRAIPADIVDSLSLISPRASKFISKCHVNIYRYAPRAFRKGYAYSEDHEGIFSEQKLIYKYLSSGVAKLYDYIRAGAYDTVLCVHVFPALMLSELKHTYNIDLKTAFVSTDYTCSPSVAESDLDYYFIAHDGLIQEYCDKGVARDKLCPSGIAVRRAFYEYIAKETARQQIGINGRHNILLVGGSMGCGPIESLTAELAAILPDDYDLTVISGTNEKLRSALLPYSSSQVHILGYTEHFPLLLSAADVLITKPGGLSITEAAAKHTPMLFLDVVGGCEHRNMDYFIAQGWGEALAEETAAADCLKLVADPGALQSKTAKLMADFKEISAVNICDRLI